MRTMMILAAALCAATFAQATNPVEPIQPVRYQLILVSYADETQEFHWCESCRVVRIGAQFRIVDTGDGNHVFFNAHRLPGETTRYADENYEYTILQSDDQVIIVNDVMKIELVPMCN